MKYKIKINGTVRSAEAEPGTSLLWVIRDELKLTGTKFGCGVAACGACTVHINGSARRSCITPIETIKDAEVTTIEGVNSKVAKVVQQTWNELNVVQCGYCQSGQILSAVSLLSKNNKPTSQEIDRAMQGNVCRCATYTRIKQAIVKAAKILKA